MLQEIVHQLRPQKKQILSKKTKKKKLNPDLKGRTPPFRRLTCDCAVLRHGPTVGQPHTSRLSLYSCCLDMAPPRNACQAARQIAPHLISSSNCVRICRFFRHCLLPIFFVFWSFCLFGLPENPGIFVLPCTTGGLHTQRLKQVTRKNPICSVATSTHTPSAHPSAHAQAVASSCWTQDGAIPEALVAVSATHMLVDSSISCSSAHEHTGLPARSDSDRRSGRQRRRRSRCRCASVLPWSQGRTRRKQKMGLSERPIPAPKVSTCVQFRFPRVPYME